MKKEINAKEDFFKNFTCDDSFAYVPGISGFEKMYNGASWPGAIYQPIKPRLNSFKGRISLKEHKIKSYSCPPIDFNFLTENLPRTFINLKQTGSRFRRN